MDFCTVRLFLIIFKPYLLLLILNQLVWATSRKMGDLNNLETLKLHMSCVYFCRTVVIEFEREIDSVMTTFSCIHAKTGTSCSLNY